MNFYLSAVDDCSAPGRPAEHRLILCKSKNAIIAEYALRDTKKPIGISGFRVTESLRRPEGEPPTIKELEDELKAEGIA